MKSCDQLVGCVYVLSSSLEDPLGLMVLYTAGFSMLQYSKDLHCAISYQHVEYMFDIQQYTVYNA